MNSFSIRKRLLFDVLMARTDDNYLQSLNNFLQREYDLSSEQLKDVNDRLSRYFLPQFKQKWQFPFNVKSKFESKFADWLDSDFTVTFGMKVLAGMKSRVSYGESSTSTKRRRLLELEDLYSPLQIQEAFIRNLKKSGCKNVVDLITSMLQSNKAENIDSEGISEITPYSAEEAVALIEDLKLSKYQYEILETGAKKRNVNLYPSYYYVMQAKKECYPQEIYVSETEGRMNIQRLIDHTVSRLFKDPTVQLPLPTNRNKTCNLNLTFKYGCDGTSDQKNYKQTFTNSDISDSSIFTMSMVPLCLKSSDQLDTFWRNPHPGSPRRCIPILISFAKETKEYTQMEVEKIKTEIKNLEPTKVNTENGLYVVQSHMHLTMVDGKVCQALSNTKSSATCYICGANPSEMNDLEYVMQKTEEVSNLEFGLSTLHAWIRCMECILHISYRLGFSKWAAKTDEHKEMLKSAKTKICTDFKEKMGLIVDQPRQGSGTSNDGNTARRFFSDVEMTAEITGVNKELIKRFRHILMMLSCSHKVPTQFFNKFAFETAQLYVNLYDWYNMPSSVHKILLHGGQVMDKFILPIGQYSEEAAEARNKDIRHFRQFNTRKFSRIANMEDLVHKLLISSDMYIASKRQSWHINPADIDPEIMELIKQFESES